MPEPKNLLEATEEGTNRAAIADILYSYQRNMKTLVGRNTPYVASRDLKKKHKEFSDSAVESFKMAKKFGQQKFSEAYLKQLKSSIQEAWIDFEEHNHSKKTVFDHAQTFANQLTIPGCIIVAFLLFYFCMQLPILSLLSFDCSVILI